MPATIPESHRHLLDERVCALATIGPDGRPQLTAVWFLYEEGEVRISLNTARQKVRNLQRHSGCAVLIYDSASPYRYVEIRGDALVTADEGYEFAERLGAKYGSDLRAMDGPDGTRVVASIVPERVNAVDLTPYF
jgi:PPOX class probable F420-dependent enzyme